MQNEDVLRYNKCTSLKGSQISHDKKDKIIITIFIINKQYVSLGKGFPNCKKAINFGTLKKFYIQNNNFLPPHQVKVKGRI